MAEYDLVVPVREGAANEALRYALRSWAVNLPHRRVWLVGYRPPWAHGVEHIPTHQAGRTKYANTTAAARAACEHPDVSETFLWANDDMFVMRRQEAMPVFHRGPVREVEAYYAARGNGSYLRGLRETRDLLVGLGHTDPLSYELHLPMSLEKGKMLEVLEIGGHLDVLHKRTAYGVLAGIGGTRMRDVKILHRAPRGYEGLPFLSTMPDTFTNGHVGRYIRESFRQPGPYERRGRR